MSIPAIGAASVAIAPKPTPVVAPSSTPAAAEAPGTNDHDGDDKVAASISPAASSSNAVRAALTSLKIGG